MKSRKKLKIDDLRVDSFEVMAEEGARGTVHGAEGSFFCPDASYDMSDCAECPSNTNCTNCRSAMYCDTAACTDWLDSCFGGCGSFGSTMPV